MTDFTPTWYDEPYPLDHTITWREHFARNPGAFHWTHSMQCDCNRTDKPNE